MWWLGARHEVQRCPASALARRLCRAAPHRHLDDLQLLVLGEASTLGQQAVLVTDLTPLPQAGCCVIRRATTLKPSPPGPSSPLLMNVDSCPAPRRATGTTCGLREFQNVTIPVKWVWNGLASSNLGLFCSFCSFGFFVSGCTPPPTQFELCPPSPGHPGTFFQPAQIVPHLSCS